MPAQEAVSTAKPDSDVERIDALIQLADIERVKHLLDEELVRPESRFDTKTSVHSDREAALDEGR